MKQFIETKPDENYQIYRMVCDNYEIGITAVIYGFRVSAGFIDSGMYTLNYCCGNDRIVVQIIFDLVLTILTKRINDAPIPNSLNGKMFVFSEFPVQDERPMYFNDSCFRQLAFMTLESDAITLTKLPDIYKIKTEYLLKLHNN